MRMSRRWERIGVVLGVCLPIPLSAASGLTIPLPAVVERIAASLVPFADAATLESNQALAPGARGSIVLLARDGGQATTSPVRPGSYRNAKPLEPRRESKAAATSQDERGSGSEQAKPDSGPTAPIHDPRGDGPAIPKTGPTHDPKNPQSDSGEPPTSEPGTPPRDDNEGEKPSEKPIEKPIEKPADAPILPPIDPPKLPPIDPPDLPPVNPPDLPPINVPGLPPVDPPKLPPVQPPDLPTINPPRLPPIGLP